MLLLAVVAAAVVSAVFTFVAIRKAAQDVVAPRQGKKLILMIDDNKLIINNFKGTYVDMQAIRHWFLETYSHQSEGDQR
jgi:hypothetical protein